MFDEYIPDPPLNCPACGKELEGWQGIDGPCALMVWRQGVAAPVKQQIADEDVRLTAEDLDHFRLPEQFLIYTNCCGGDRGLGFFVEAECRTNQEIWMQADLITAETAKQHKNERRADFRKRLKWLKGQSG